MVRHGAGPCKDRRSLAILAVAAGKEECIHGREAVGKDGALAHEATLDARAIHHPGILGDDKFAGSDIHAYLGTTTDGALLEQRGTVDAHTLLDVDLAQKPNTRDCDVVGNAAYRVATLLDLLHDQLLEACDGLHAVAHHRHKVGRLCREVAVYHHLAATILVYRRHLDTLTKGGGVATLHACYGIYVAVVANVVVLDHGVGNSTVRAYFDMTLKAHVEELLGAEVLGNENIIPRLCSAGACLEHGALLGGQSP